MRNQERADLESGTDSERSVRFELEPTRAAWEAAAEALRRQIDLGLLRPNGRLPSERELAEWMGLSRVPVAQALRNLQGQGLVASQGRTGGLVVLPPRVRSGEEVLEEMRRRKDEVMRIL